VPLRNCSLTLTPLTPTFLSTTQPQRKRSITHSLARVNDNGDRPTVSKQTVPAYNGLHAGLHMHQGKSTAYFHTSYNQLPNNSVVKDVKQAV